MSLNFAGLGATVGVKDDGALDFSEKLAGSFGGIVTSLSGVASGAATAGFALGKMLSSGVHNIASAVAGMANFVNGPMKLTTEFEAMSQAHSVSTRKILGQNGILGKDLDKLNGQAAGLAMGMKVSDQIAGQAVASFKRFGKELKAVGIASAEDGVKLEDGMGVSTVALGNHLHTLSTQFKFTDKQLDETTKMLNGVGATMGDIPGQFKEFPQYLDLIRDYSSLAARGVRAIGGVDVIKSLTNAQNHLYQLSGDSEMAKKAAFGLEKVLSQSLDQFQDMFAGTQADLHPFMEAFSIVGGDIDDAFKSASQGSDAFIMKMAQAVVNLKKQGGNTEAFFTMFEGQMKKAMDPEAAKALVTSLRHVSAAQLDTMKSSKVMGESLGKTAKDVWRSSMTLEEAYQMVTGAGMATFRQLGMGAARKFVDDTKKAFADFNAHAKKEVAAGGALGTIYQKMSEIAILGPKALVPEKWRGQAAVFGQMYDAIAPTLGQVTQLTGAMSGLLNPMTLVTAAIGGLVALVYKNKNEKNTWADAILGAWHDVKAQLNEWANYVLEWANDFDWAKVFDTLFHGMEQAIKGLTNIFNDIAKPISNTVENAFGPKELTFGGVGKKIFDALSKSFKSIKWGELFKNLFAAQGDAKNSLLDRLNSFIKETFDKKDQNYSVFKDIGQFLGSGLVSALGYMADSLKQNQEAMAKAREILLSLGMLIAQNLPALYDGFRAGIKGSGTGGTILWDMFHPLDALEDIGKWLGDVAYKLVQGISEIWDKVKASTNAIWSAMWEHSTIPDMVQSGIEHMKAYVEGLLSFFEGPVVQRISAAFTTVKNAISGLFGGSKSPGAFVGADMEDATKTVEGAMGNIKVVVKKAIYEGVVESITDGFATAFKNVAADTDKFMKTEKELFRDFTQKVADMFTRMWVGILEQTQQASDAAARTIGKALSDLNNLNEALARAKSIDATVAKDTAERKDGQFVKKPGESSDEYIARAINMPNWYENYYAQQFDNGIAAIVTAITSNKMVATTTPGLGAGETANAFRQKSPGAFSGSSPPAGALRPK